MYFCGVSNNCSLPKIVLWNEIKLSNIIFVFAANLCLTNPCLNGGACQLESAVVKCTCLPNYIGQTCETREFYEYLKCFRLDGCKHNPLLKLLWAIISPIWHSITPLYFKCIPMSILFSHSKMSDYKSLLM